MRGMCVSWFSCHGVRIDRIALEELGWRAGEGSCSQRASVGLRRFRYAHIIISAHEEKRRIGRVIIAFCAQLLG